MVTNGTKGTYNGMEVEVTKVHDDGALDLQKVWSDGAKENLPWYERVPADQFTAVQTEAPQAEGGLEPGSTEPPQPEGVTLENVHAENNAEVVPDPQPEGVRGTYGKDEPTDTPEDEIPPAGV